MFKLLVALRESIRFKRALVKSLLTDDWQCEGGYLYRGHLTIEHYAGPCGLIGCVIVRIHGCQVWLPPLACGCVKRAVRTRLAKLALSELPTKRKPCR